MNAGQLLRAFSQIIAILTTEGIIDAQGNFVDDLQSEIRAFSAIEAQLKADGIVVPSKVDQIIQALPLILSLVK